MSISNQRYSKTVSEVRNVSVDMRGKLDTNELCTGTPTITEFDTADLTLANAQVSTAILSINGSNVPAGQAVQFSVGGGVAQQFYKMILEVDTTASPPQTLVEDLILLVEED